MQQCDLGASKEGWESLEQRWELFWYYRVVLEHEPEWLSGGQDEAVRLSVGERATDQPRCQPWPDIEPGALLFGERVAVHGLDKLVREVSELCLHVLTAFHGPPEIDHVRLHRFVQVYTT
jgi:hypothetical protein